MYIHYSLHAYHPDLPYKNLESTYQQVVSPHAQLMNVHSCVVVHSMLMNAETELSTSGVATVKAIKIAIVL